MSLSRARVCLIVVGNINRLRISSIWRSLIVHAKSLNNCMDLTKTDQETFLEDIQRNPKQIEFRQ